ncbi:hypothetical protein PROFUN_06016 [Planoprotostelium fungivorum]|uniref:Uncharacterized protein n=1 Tax=Planoprotostelium fungivorum TaxID=1890364 RepID=A0A2P6NPE2_9EUKA|nr:hypothetical protein PROFUN_06016 [Planoprotostelium fungivorum]
MQIQQPFESLKFFLRSPFGAPVRLKRPPFICRGGCLELFHVSADTTDKRGQSIEKSRNLTEPAEIRSERVNLLEKRGALPFDDDAAACRLLKKRWLRRSSWEIKTPSSAAPTYITDHHHHCISRNAANVAVTAAALFESPQLHTEDELNNPAELFEIPVLLEAFLPLSPTTEILPTTTPPSTPVPLHIGSTETKRKVLLISRPFRTITNVVEAGLQQLKSMWKLCAKEHGRIMHHYREEIEATGSQKRSGSNTDEETTQKKARVKSRRN